MIINKFFLTPNEYSRPQKNIKKVMGIILHWTGPNGHTARQVRSYFENDCPKLEHYSSAHYVIDFSGEILQLMPNYEMAYHCGSSKIDPISKKVYTDWAREKFGDYANNSKYLSPNQVTIGIEMCASNEMGDFNNQVIESAIELTTSLCKEFNLTSNEIGTHNLVVGWKDCPRLWTNKPYLFDAFKNDIKMRLQ